MRIFGIEIHRTAVSPTVIPDSALIDSPGLWSRISEPFTGAWQRNIECETPRNLTAFSAVYACINMIARDIAKMRPMLMQLTPDGIWIGAVPNSPFWGVLRKPNLYQTHIQFLMYWMVSKLMYGNTYVLKERDDRGIVRRLYVLDPRLVKVLVTNEGGIYYELKRDNLSRGEEDTITVPLSEIIHDRSVTLWHPLIGVSPLYACGASATQGIRIQNNSARFFENMSRPSGMLTAPHTIDDITARRLKLEFEKNFSGSNIGRMMVAGDSLDYKPFTMPPEQAQMVEQLGWTVSDVARAFGVPLHKLSINDNQKFANFSAMNQDYYSQTLQCPMQEIEVLLSEGLEVNKDTSTMYAVKLDVANLLRMDPQGRAESNGIFVQRAIKSPNEARLEENLPPVEGGDDPIAQEQNWPLSVLAQRPPPVTTPPAVTTPPPPAAGTEPAKDVQLLSDEAVALAVAKQLTDELLAKFAAEELAL